MEIDTFDLILQASARKGLQPDSEWNVYANRLGNVLEIVATQFPEFSGWNMVAGQDRYGPRVEADPDTLERFLIAKRLKDDRGKVMAGAGSRIGLIGGEFDGNDMRGRIYLSGNLGGARSYPDYLELDIRDEIQSYVRSSAGWAINLLDGVVQKFSAYHAYVRESPLENLFKDERLFCMGNFTYIPRPLSESQVPEGVRQEVMGDGAVLVLPSGEPQELLPLCRQLAGPVAELVEW